MSHSTQKISHFGDKPISWHSTEETKHSVAVNDGAAPPTKQ